jgi:rhamnogalacturonan endolyase
MQAPCTGPLVKVSQAGAKFTFDNGLVKTTIDASDATVPSFVFNGVEVMKDGGYFTFGTNVYTASPFTGKLSADPSKNAGEVAEVSLTSTWNGAAGSVPLDLEVRYALPRCSQGLYEYLVLTHPSTYPAFTPGEMRVNHYLKLDDPFDWYAVDDARRGPFLSQADEDASQAITGAPKEVRKYSTGPFADRPGWQKYDNTVEWGEGTVYGFSSSSRKIGLWIINPNNEYLPGGPLKTELTVHQGGSGRGALLNYWGGSHFYGSLEALQTNQRREKVLGPWLLYANSTTLAGKAGQDELWGDASYRLNLEKAAWPYAWETDPRYPQSSGRGAVSGRVVFTDPQLPQVTAAYAWVGLANPSVAGAPNFEHQGWDYQYWVHADSQGSFTLANVRPGNYTLHAFRAGIHGVYVGQANAVTVSAGKASSLGNVAWAADRRGATVWEIGIPDRTPKEFFRGDQAWHYGTNLLFGKDFPNGVTYTVGTSTPAQNWNYLQPGGTWYIDFTIDAIPTSASAASLVLDVAGSDGVTLDVTLNGSALGTAKASYDDGSIDRDQPHGTLQGGRIAVPLSRLKTGSNRLGITPTGRLMWDYLRLEWVTA